MVFTLAVRSAKPAPALAAEDDGPTDETDGGCLYNPETQTHDHSSSSFFIVEPPAMLGMSRLGKGFLEVGKVIFSNPSSIAGRT